MSAASNRNSGLLVPLFSLWSRRGWGIGEIGDIPAAARWMRSAGQTLLQLLPINEMPPSDTSPYSALSAMAIDPVFLTMAHVEDFAAAGGEAGLDPELRAALDGIRRRMQQRPQVDYAEVRRLKQTVLERAFARFRETEWRTRSVRARGLRGYIEDEGWWLDDYSLFRALHAKFGERQWSEWPAGVRDRDPAALALARIENADDILFRQYLQWLADAQWRAARTDAGPIALFGDLPFMVSGDSADVWARQHEFRMDASVGVPPDAFSATGQNWNLPVYRWDVIAAGGFEWLRHRARRNAALFDGYRVDHLVGFYRTYYRLPGAETGAFTPEDEADQTALGERILGILREPGVRITAEDLGVVPDFVRASLVRVGVPGYKVFRWEREWHADGQPFIDPAEYAALTVATSGTHDTEPLAVWWENASPEERAAVLASPSIRRSLTGEELRQAQETATMTSPVHRALLGALCASGSDILIMPIQDVFGWSERINTPATVNDGNWTWALPWPVDRLTAEPEASAVAENLCALALACGRT